MTTPERHTCKNSEGGRPMNEERCVCCGAVIPEGRQVCLTCESKWRQVDLEKVMRCKMDDSISRQAAIETLDGEIEITGRANAEAVKDYVRLVKGRIEHLPAADVVKVVRCRDCEYCQEIDPYESWCAGFGNPARMVTPTDFCSHGKRRKAND